MVTNWDCLERRREELEIMFGDDSDEEAFYDRTGM